ncbi:hypothetical protein ACRAWD_30345 [Caulobacter segnis]
MEPRCASALDGVLVGALDDATPGRGTFGFLAPRPRPPSSTP